MNSKLTIKCKPTAKPRHTNDILELVSSSNDLSAIVAVDRYKLALRDRICRETERTNNTYFSIDQILKFIDEK